MINFEKEFAHELQLGDTSFYEQSLGLALNPRETVLITFTSPSVGAVFTGKRIIFIDLHGLMGQQKEIDSIPYRNILYFSYVKIGMERVLELRCIDIGVIRMRFANKACLSDAYRIVSTFVLD